MSHPLFPSVVKDSWVDDLRLKPNVDRFTTDVKIWNKEVFGNLSYRKNRVEARLRGIQTSLANSPSDHLLNLEAQLRKEYFEILQQEEEFWSVKSRYNWLIQRDRNTNFFHTSAVIRSKRNRISCLKDRKGNWVHSEEDIAALIKTRYQDLFSSSASSAPRAIWEIPTWPCYVPLEDKGKLTSEINILEVKEELWSMKPFKAPRPDELHADFFQTY